MDINTPNLNRLFSTAGQKNQQQGTGYTNLNRVFQANAGNQLGQKVAGNVQSQIGSVQSQLGEQQNQFKTESEKNKVGGEEDTKNRDAVIGRFNDPSGSAGVLSDADTTSFSKYTGGAYGGPQSLKDTSLLKNTADQLRGQVSNFSPSGTQELLRRTVGGNRYTQGQQRLDSLLMDKSQLNPVQRQASALGQQVNRADLAASGQAELYKNQAKQFGQETRDKLGAGLEGIDTSVQGQLTATQTAEKSRQKQLTDLLGTLQGEMIPKLDAAGKAMVDENGQPILERKLTGVTDPYARIDTISKSLKDQGLVNQNQFESLFGKGNFAQSKSDYDTGLDNVRKNEVLELLNRQAIPGGYAGGTGEALYSLRNKTRIQDQFGIGNFDNSIMNPNQQNALALSSKVQNYIAGNKDKYGNENPLSGEYDDVGTYNAALADMFKGGLISDADIAGTQNAQFGNNKDIAVTSFGQIRNNAADRVKELENFKSATGMGGRSTLENNQDNFYKTMAQSLEANTTQAQNLNAQGVASGAQRSNYEALNKLLGKTTDQSKYQSYKPTVDANGNKIEDPTAYKAGRIGLDAAQIKRTLGYE